jgi:hypothetical protein
VADKSWTLRRNIGCKVSPCFVGSSLANNLLKSGKYDGDIADLWNQQEATRSRQQLRHKLQMLVVQPPVKDLEITPAILDQSEDDLEITQSLHTRLRLQGTAGEPSSSSQR